MVTRSFFLSRLLVMVSVVSVITGCAGLLRPAGSESDSIGDLRARYSHLKRERQISTESIKSISGDSIVVARRLVMPLPGPPLQITPEVQRELAHFSRHDGRFVRNSLERATAHRQIVAEIFRDEGIPHELMALAVIESGFNSQARSPVGAVGIWQFIKSTARMYGLTVGLRRDDRHDPILSTLAAARHLRDLYHEYGDWYLALAAYNAGRGAVDRLIARLNTKDFWEIARSGKLNSETKRYVPRFIAAALMLREPHKYGLLEQAEVG